jgi:hypothetical protein
MIEASCHCGAVHLEIDSPPPAEVNDCHCSDNPELGAAEEEAMGTVLAVLASCGVRGEEEAIHAARGLRSIAHGFATLEEAGGFGMSLDPDESFRKLMRAFAAGLRSGGS